MPYQQLEGYVPEDNASEEESFPNITHGTRLWALISLVLSAVGIILTLVPALGVFFGIFGVGFAVYSRMKNGYFSTSSVWGIVLGCVALACCSFFLVYNALSEAGFALTLFDLLI